MANPPSDTIPELSDEPLRHSTQPMPDLEKRVPDQGLSLKRQLKYPRFLTLEEKHKIRLHEAYQVSKFRNPDAASFCIC